MKRRPDVEDLRLWSVIASTVRPLKPSLPLVGRDDREAVRVGESNASTQPKPATSKSVPRHPRPTVAAQRSALPTKGKEAPADVEAGLHRRLNRGREAVAARIDLHGMTQDVARAFSAACTPDTFVFDGERRLVYRGQLDNSRPGNDLPVTAADVRAAIDAVLAGRPVDAEQRPSIGCGIKWR